MDEERICMYCEQLLADIVMAKECLDCAQMIGQKIANEEELFHANFFHITRNSLLYTGTIILCKAFEENCKEKPISILQLLAWVEITLKLKPSQKEDIAKWKEQCKNDIIERLKTQRDKFYAHNDKTDLEQLEEGYGISYQERMQIIDLALWILSYIISLCKKIPVSKYHIETCCKSELETIMNEIAFMNKNKGNLSAYIRWCRNHDEPET